eukprot:353336-Chlamydomonas_euryale.AAC.8
MGAIRELHVWRINEHQAVGIRWKYQYIARPGMLASEDRCTCLVARLLHHCDASLHICTPAALTDFLVVGHRRVESVLQFVVHARMPRPCITECGGALERDRCLRVSRKRHKTGHTLHKLVDVEKRAAKGNGDASRCMGVASIDLLQV